MLSVDSLIRFYESKDDDIEKNNIKIYKRRYKTTDRKSSIKEENFMKRLKLKIPKRNENVKLPKKIRIKKFLTTVSSFENQKNYNLEKIRFDKFWKEKTYHLNRPLTTSRTKTGRNMEKTKYKKYVNNSVKGVKPKKLKKNLKIEISDEKEKNSENKIINYSNVLSLQKIKKFCDFQEIWAKFIDDKKNNIKQKIFQREQNQLNKYFRPYTNRYYNKTKYNKEKAIEQLNRKYELDYLKKKYKQNQITYVHKPVININKYKKILPKYNKYANNNRMKSSKEKSKEKSLSDRKKKNINIDNKSKEKSVNNKNKNFTTIIEDINKKKKEKKNKNSLKYLISNVNNKKRLIKDNIYYLNVNETTSCDTYVNKINFQGRQSFIKKIIMESNEASKYI